MHRGLKLREKRVIFGELPLESVHEALSSLLDATNPLGLEAEELLILEQALARDKLQRERLSRQLLDSLFIKLPELRAVVVKSTETKN